MYKRNTHNKYNRCVWIHPFHTKYTRNVEIAMIFVKFKVKEA